jgi:NAD(P)-dependent dehydrogenase (short-subunit alcohol dehydrogenase family)
MATTTGGGPLKSAIITGGNIGIGFNAAGKLLARGGYQIVLACRSKERGEAAAAQLREHKPSTSNGEVSVIPCDLSSVKSINEFAAEYARTHDKLHLLILNAGVFAAIAGKPEYTADGFERTFGTNHLGHFALTQALLPLLRASAPSRVAVTSSDLHASANANYGPADWQLLLNGGAAYSGRAAYNNSKLANVLFARELNKREAGNGVTANALHPGIIPSSELLRFSGVVQGIARMVMQPLGRLFGLTHTLDDGGDATMAASFAEEGGLYFDVRHPKECSVQGRNAELAARLWADSEALLAGLPAPSSIPATGSVA